MKIPLELRAAASPALMERGCVNVIGLDPIRDQIGARWPQLRERVYLRAEALLRQKLGSTDFFARLGDDAYLVTMPAAEPDDVSAVCVRVAYELQENFLGQCGVDDIRVSGAKSEGADSFSLDPLSGARIVAMAEKAGIQDLLPATGEEAADRSAESESRPMRLRDGIDPLLIAHHFIPMWDTQNGAITTYISAAKSVRAPHPPHPPVPLAQMTTKERIQLELSCVRTGIARLAAGVSASQRFLLGLTVSFDVLGSPAGRMEYASACRGLSSEYRQYIVFFLTDVPPGVAQTRLADLVNALRPFSRAVCATVHPNYRNYLAYQGVGLRSIGIDLTQYNTEAQLRYEQDDIAHLANMAKTMNLGTFLVNVGNPGSLDAAYNAGIHWISGTAVAAPCDEPRSMTRLTWGDVRSREILSA